MEDILDKASVLGVEAKPVLVGGGTDGASVNIGSLSSMRSKLQSALPFLFWSWCYAHRLELACKDAFASPLCGAVLEMLLRLYYLYEKSPKKSHELATIAEDLKEVFELPKGGNLPIRSSGTRWISHKRKALQRVVDRYGVYINHLSTLAEDKSVKSDDRARLKGYLLKWRHSKILIGCAMYVDAMKPISLLSLTLQGHSVDIVLCIEHILKTSKALKSIETKDPLEWPTVKLVLDRIKKVGEDSEYQGATLKGFDVTTLQYCKKQVLSDLQRLILKMRERLEWTDTTLLRSLLVFIETKGWSCRETDDEDEDKCMAEVKDAVEHITSVFRSPLEAKGVAIESVLDEVEETVDYARRYLSIGTDSYQTIWYKLHTCHDSHKWPNVLLLCELVFSLPFSNSRVEQAFSSLKVIKTRIRTNLSTSTLCDLLELNIEGPPLSSFNPEAAVELWWKDCNTTRRVHQQPRKQYRPRKGKQDQAPTGDSQSDREQDLILEEWDRWFKTDSDDEDQSGDSSTL